MRLVVVVRLRDYRELPGTVLEQVENCHEVLSFCYYLLLLIFCQRLAGEPGPGAVQVGTTGASLFTDVAEVGLGRADGRPASQVVAARGPVLKLPALVATAVVTFLPCLLKMLLTLLFCLVQREMNARDHLGFSAAEAD